MARWTHVPQTESQTQSGAELPVVVRRSNCNCKRQFVPGITHSVNRIRVNKTASFEAVLLLCRVDSYLLFVTLEPQNKKEHIGDKTAVFSRMFGNYIVSRLLMLCPVWHDSTFE